MAEPIRIYFFDEGDKEVLSITLTSMPFTEGQIIDLKVSNGNKDAWNVEEKSGQFLIKSIKHHIEKRYPSSDYISNIRSSLSTVIIIEPINNPKPMSNLSEQKPICTNTLSWAPDIKCNTEMILAESGIVYVCPMCGCEQNSSS